MTKRVNILYGGSQYSVGQADVEAIKATVEQAFTTGTALWITVNHGEGRPQPAELLVGPGIPISIIPIPADDDEAEAAVEANGVGRNADADLA
ncbi:hypothetical protein ACFPER_00200 [Agromyces aurantiacus]|uniref:Uncharacterized protein n=1 Tax=Agromyces aurantiacus TaxID=165814 RepID=A0ABV9QZ83_9MICO|nr:hypothetical protein [Agromyces aurantiacus]MBM7505503.1 hypothetical protein [Agromyces aurantiacus]